MNVIENENVIFFDVDDTLIREPTEEEFKNFNFISFTNFNINVGKTPINKNRDLLRQFKARNYTVIVWSHGGYAWAKEVITKLGASEYVDYIMTKPRVYVDDISVNEWATRLHLAEKEIK